LKKQKKSR